ncbi:hypothetical protein SAMN04488103_102155 [Gemmobacter aquatilis]|uniref:Uncharacterized protein n=1 Tax=Gemmobacter aquatilis TaxID=933059 RepID=A0A1H8BH31_9RHOB|nr:hypothetical protein [Gemmobacter aquatilis]SEM81434.1 hypothetical protein SAMN04488103_102155 [Gemmobacter aquatilis]
MSDLAELERRITAALARIGAGLDALSTAEAAPPQAGVAEGEQAAEIAALQSALEAERAINAQLNERLRAVKERDGEEGAKLQARLEQLTRQLDVQGLELQRMRKSTIQLRESLRQLREQKQGEVEAHLLNKAMLAELEALRAARSSEVAELDEILAELTPILAGTEKTDA